MYPRRSVANNGDGLVRIVVAVVPFGRMAFVALEIFQPLHIGPTPFAVMLISVKEAGFSFSSHLLQHALPRYEKVGIFNESASGIFHCDLPLTKIFLPYRFCHFMIEVHIAIEVPFLRRLFDIGLDILPSGVKMAPIRLGVKWKSLPMSITEHEAGQMHT